ncbi:hypothetical protein PFISCL1PPCAC_5884 [Pristionchus fissidentatus]|uniref:G protein-coupled receptor n=1 Tax=Pristionchus fissidentatus TaxID=1538716 RepID=A0AAV5V4R9_9BILA|nr:hypothetical protein PFISCL1PPCAC_5884 [Pristionchus fissidentatus]
MVHLFSNGLFTLDGSSLVVLLSLSNIFCYVLWMVILPQMWYYSLVGFANFIVIVGILRRSNIILTIFFFLNAFTFVLWSIFSIVAIVSLIVTPIDEITRRIGQNLMVDEKIVSEYVTTSVTYAIAIVVLSWTYSYIALSALYHARKETMEVYKVPSEMNQKPIV